MIFSDTEGIPVKKEIKKPKILIVDDEKFNCDILMSFLMILGVKNRNNVAELAHNGQEAVKKIQDSIDQGDPYKFNIIFMDCNMPFMDGFEATQEIRKIYQRQKITLTAQPHITGLTGYDGKETQDKCLASGMNAYHNKPISIADIAVHLKNFGYISKIPENI